MFDGLFGVLSVHGRPTVFLQERSNDDRIGLRDQRLFWSQGVAPILVRVTPHEYQIYSGLSTPALDPEDVDKDGRLVDVFLRATQTLEVREFLRSVEVGSVYANYPGSFNPERAVDFQLVQNLRSARERLSSGSKAPDLPTIHRVLGRVLFSCYLEARGALGGKDFGGLGAGATASFRKIVSLQPPQLARQALTRLFRRLGRYFRGNLFDVELAEDLVRLRDSDIVTLADLVTGANLSTRQAALPFDVYDFRAIPIETLSAVYEDFVRAEDATAQRKQGAYYTPPKLVDFVFDLATENTKDIGSLRVLDPGCGSGVFLVAAFNRIAEAWVRRHERARNGTRAEALARILREQICGVDLNPIACQATCFSLYMAMLDFLDPPEIRSLGKQRLPMLLAREDEKRRATGAHTVIEGDFLSGSHLLEARQFDLIVGNPPWVARGNVETDSMALWEARHADDGLTAPARQVACAFMWEAPLYLAPRGQVCFLLPAGVLLGDRTSAFQERWFGQHSVEKVALLSDLRFYLFPGADHPAVAIRYRAGAPDPKARFVYLAPKTSQTSLSDNVVAVEPDDYRTIATDELLANARNDDAPFFWFSYNWASPRDREFLSRLMSLPRLGKIVGKPGEDKRWVKGQGLQAHGEDSGQYEPHWKPKDRFVYARSDFELLLGRHDTVAIEDRFPDPHRARDPRLFRSPLVLFNKGFSKAAYSPFAVFFQHALQSIAGPEEDRELLMFLAATLMSPLAAYFAFHLTSKPIYRGNPLLAEVLRMPFPMPEDAPGESPVEAVRSVADVFAKTARDPRFGGLGHHQLLDAAKKEMLEHVYLYYGISADERILIKDTVDTLQESATPSRGSSVPTLVPCDFEVRKAYANTLIEALRAWAGGAGANLSAEGVVSTSAGLAVLSILKSRSPSPYKEVGASSALGDVLERLRKVAPERYGSLVYLRNIAVLERDRIHIVKPLSMRFWLRSAALNDADAAASQLLFGRQRNIGA